MKKFLLAILLVGLVAPFAAAEIVVSVGSNDVLANTANQQIDILISSDPGDPDLSGMNLRVTIGDGLGPMLEPVFQGAEGSLDGFSVTGSIFDVPGAVESGEGPVNGAPSLINGGVTTPTNVNANGVLISLFVDTTGFFDVGSFDLVFSNVLGDTELLGPIGSATPLPGVVFENGTINITAAVPEPSGMVVLGALACVGLVRRRRV